MRLRGDCVFVEVEYDGSSLASDHPIGATVLDLENDDDFTEAGLLEVGYDTGDGSVSWTQYGYTFDEDLDAVVLDEPLTVAAPAETDVRTLTDGAAVEVRRYMAVDLGDGGDEVEADIKSGDRGITPVGDARAGSLVEVESLAVGEYEFVRFLTEEPDIDSSTISTPFIRGYLTTPQLIFHNTLTQVGDVVPGWTVDPQRSGIELRASDGAFMVPEAGFYSVTATASWAPNSSGARYLIIQRINDNVVTDLRQTAMAASLNISVSFQASVEQYFVEGDGIRVAVQQTSGSGLDLVGNADGSLTAIEIVRTAAVA